jgi:hypothetical protein
LRITKAIYDGVDLGVKNRFYLATPQFLNSKWEDLAEELGIDREYYHSMGGNQSNIES